MEDYNKLDVAAKIFPAVSTKNNSSVFRVAVILKEKVDRLTLQLAVNMIYERYALFFLRMRRGFFWNYFDENHIHFRVEEEGEPPCSTIVAHENNGYFLKVLYFGNRISVEVFHSITDGSGVVEFIKSLTYYYLTIKHGALDSQDKVLLFDESVDNDHEDSFNKQFSNKKDIQPRFGGRMNNAFRLKGKRYRRHGQSAITGVVSVAAVKAKSKEHGCTISAYLIAKMIVAIYEQKQRETKSIRPIVVAVPVNLRKIFKSTTLKNFFGVVNVGYAMTPDTTFERLISSVSAQLGLSADEKHLETASQQSVKASNNVFSKHIPLVFKNIILPVAFTFMGEVKKSITFSNVGRIDFPDDMKPYIEHAELLLYPTPKSPINCGLCSFEDKLSITFTKTILDTSVIREFFRSLGADTASDIAVYSNIWGEANEQM